MNLNEEIKVAQFITLLRIYDVLMAMYTEQNPEGSDELLKLHKEGNLLGSSPAMAQFLGDLD